MAGRLVEPQNLDKVIFLFCTAQQVDFEEVVDKLRLMMVKSQTLVKVCCALASQPPAHPWRGGEKRMLLTRPCYLGLLLLVACLDHVLLLHWCSV